VHIEEEICIALRSLNLENSGTQFGNHYAKYPEGFLGGWR
jgi:hypothetical protein